VECPVVWGVECPVEWEAECLVECLGDQGDPDPNNSHQTQVQGPVQCQGSLINLIPLIKAIHHFSHLDHRAYLLRLEWGIRVQRRRSPCWLSRTGIWKPSNGGTSKRGNREQEVA